MLSSTIQHDFWVKVTDVTRRQEWLSVFGDDVVPVRSPIPERAELPGFPDAMVYLVALEKVPLEVRQRIADFVTQKFQLSPPLTVNDLDQVGLPIHADNCCTIILNPQKWID